MKTAVIFAALLAVAFSLDIQMELLKEDPKTLKLWEDFIIKYRRTETYTTTQDMWYRYNVFKDNLNTARYLQENDLGTAEYGVTQFMDLTKDEFKTQYLTLKPEDLPTLPRFDLKSFLGMLPDYTDAPASYDWTEHGAVTAVKNQAQCGSCWAFSTIANIEGQYFLKNNKLVSFSEQELVDCDTSKDQGCNGGLMQNAFEYLKTTGFELESDYKYTAKDGTCKASTFTSQGTVASWEMVDKDEGTIASTLATKGPLSAAINAAHFQTYMGGVMDPYFCNPAALDHGITLVGFGTDGGKDFWKIKNSWGPGWGEKGYVRIIRGKGKCGVNTNVCTATLA